jgi:hypothetical protein
MKTAEIKQQLHDYIEAIDSKKLKAIYTVVEEDIRLHADKWDDEEFVKELDRRSAEMDKSTVHTSTWEQVQANLKKQQINKKTRNAA